MPNASATDRRRGFTLVEVMISTGILSMFFLGVLLLYRTSSNSFRIGEWRAARQKSAQMLLNTLREDLEKASSPSRVTRLGAMTKVNNVPVYVLGLGLNANGGTAAIASPTSGDRGAIFFAVTTPWVEASQYTVSNAVQRGTWLGCGLAFNVTVSGGVKTSKLAYVRTGAWSRHTTEPMALPGGVMTGPTGGVIPGGEFESAVGRDLRLELEDASELSVTYNRRSSPATLEIRVRIVRPSYMAGPGAWFEETVTARLLTETNVQSF